MKTVTILMGAPGSGKSTYAKSKATGNSSKVILSLDDLRMIMFGYTESSLIDFYTHPNHKGRNEILQRTFCDLLESYLEDKDIDEIIIDNTNVEPKHVSKIIKQCRNRARFMLKTFYEARDPDTNFALLKEVNDKRVKKVPETVLKDMVKRFHANYPKINELINNATTQNCRLGVIINDPSKDNAYVFDIDGTLAHMDDRSAFEWHRVGEDSVDNVVQTMYTLIENELGGKMIICTGRDESCRGETILWLNANGIRFDELRMRKKGDFRSDWIVKHEMWEDICKNNYIAVMFDDRNQVVDHARSQGFKVFQVEPGKF